MRYRMMREGEKEKGSSVVYPHGEASVNRKGLEGEQQSNRDSDGKRGEEQGSGRVVSTKAKRGR